MPSNTTSAFRKLAALGAAVGSALALAWFVWPSPYRYDTIRLGPGTYPVRISRFSGEVAILFPDGWRSETVERERQRAERERAEFERVQRAVDDRIAAIQQEEQQLRNAAVKAQAAAIDAALRVVPADQLAMLIIKDQSCGYSGLDHDMNTQVLVTVFNGSESGLTEIVCDIELPEPPIVSAAAAAKSEAAIWDAEIERRGTISKSRRATGVTNEESQKLADWLLEAIKKGSEQHVILDGAAKTTPFHARFRLKPDGGIAKPYVNTMFRCETAYVPLPEQNSLRNTSLWASLCNGCSQNDLRIRRSVRSPLFRSELVSESGSLVNS